MADDRSYPDRPYVGVSALIQHGDHIVLIERAKPPLEGIWSLPGGAVETGETLRAAIIREINEEVGIVFEPQHIAELVEVIRHDDEDNCDRHFVIAVFYGVCIGADPTPPTLQAGDDASDAHWVLIDDIGQYPLTDGTHEVIRQILSGSKVSHTVS